MQNGNVELSVKWTLNPVSLQVAVELSVKWTPSNVNLHFAVVAEQLRTNPYSSDFPCTPTYTYTVCYFYTSLRHCCV